MRIYDNGIYRDATVEETAKMMSFNTADEQESIEQRIADIESALNALLTGRTE